MDLGSSASQSLAYWIMIEEKLCVILCLQLSAAEDSLRLTQNSHREVVEGLERNLREGAAEGSRLQTDSDKLRAERMLAVAEVGV